MASIPPAPPPPPPPPPTLQSTKVLDVSKRTPKDRQHVVGVRPTQSEERSPFANIHPETLQHATARLRKTQYREPLLSPGPAEQTLRRPDQLADRRHWEDFAFDVPVDQHRTREPIHDANSGAPQSVPIGLGVGYTHSINHTLPMSQPLPTPSPNFVNNNGNGGGAPPSTYSYSYSSSSSSANNNKNNSAFQSSQLPMAPSFNYVSKSSYSSASPFQQTKFGSSGGGNGGGGVTSSSSSYSVFSNNNSSPYVYSQQQQPSSSAFSRPPPPQQQTFNSAFQSSGSRGSNLIMDPQARIRQYATQTPASSITPLQQQQPSSQPLVSPTTVKKTSSYNTNSLAKELRDSGLTERQKYCNQFQTSLLPNNISQGPNSTIHNLYQETKQYTGAVSDPINNLINQMDYKLRTNYGPGGGSSGGGSSSSTQKQTTTTTTSTTSSSTKPANKDFCAKCGSQIVGDTPGVTALGNAYHVSCFACDVCQKQLAGCSFYSVDGKNLCQVDYMNSLEKCEKCLTPITQKILRAMGKPFHPECFACPVCAKSLDGIPFTVDKENLAYCLDCYHERFSPRCAVCLKAIAPSGNETEVARVIAMDRSYHIDCYRCEDCGLKLNSKIEGQGCYPLENHLFCKNCNLNRLKTVQ